MSEPNLQNLPRASEKNRGAQVIRNCITARPGHTMLFCDFSQIEMRILAWLSHDVNMARAFTTEGDFFVNLARQVYLDEGIDKKHPLRQRIKNVGYAKIYGAGTEKLAITAGITQLQVRETLAAFDSSFPGVRAYQDRIGREALELRAETGQAYATCPLTGRRHPSDKGKEYSLVNYVIQGAAAALFKMKLIELDHAGLGQWMVAPVHDEIILDVPNAHVEEAAQILMRVMNDYQILAPVPVEAEVSYGFRWGEKKGWDVERWKKEVYGAR
jgi:DNA polymerase-1